MHDALRPPPQVPPADRQATTPAVVLDTNAALDWLLFADPRIAPLAAAVRAGSVRWLAAPRMRAELAEVLARPALAARLPAGATAQDALGMFDRLVAACAAPPPAPGLRCRDADDQMFIDLAVAVRAAWLVTRDKALLALARPARLHGVQIVVPEAWALP